MLTGIGVYLWFTCSLQKEFNQIFVHYTLLLLLLFYLNLICKPQLEYNTNHTVNDVVRSFI